MNAKERKWKNTTNMEQHFSEKGILGCEIVKRQFPGRKLCTNIFIINLLSRKHNCFFVKKILLAANFPDTHFLKLFLFYVSVTFSRMIKLGICKGILLQSTFFLHILYISVLVEWWSGNKNSTVQGHVVAFFLVIL